MKRPEIGDTVRFYNGVHTTPEEGVVIQLLSMQFTVRTHKGYRGCLYATEWEVIPANQTNLEI